MIFSHDLWRETGPIEGGRRGSVVFPAAWPVFAAHFPGRPVVPAWVLIGAVRDLVAEGLGPVEVAAIDRVKLARPVGPGELVSIEVRFDDEGGSWRARAQLGGAAGSVGSMVLRLAPSPSV